MYCRICGKDSVNKRECNNCRYFLKHGVEESAIRDMHSDEKTKKIWAENEHIAESLARAYYEVVLENYSKKDIKNGTKEEFGFNTFVDGIRCGIDIVIPMLDEEMQEKVKAKIEGMIRMRKNSKRR